MVWRQPRNERRLATLLSSTSMVWCQPRNERRSARDRLCLPRGDRPHRQELGTGRSLEPLRSRTRLLRGCLLWRVPGDSRCDTRVGKTDRAPWRKSREKASHRELARLRSSSFGEVPPEPWRRRTLPSSLSLFSSSTNSGIRNCTVHHGRGAPPPRLSLRASLCSRCARAEGSSCSTPWERL